MENKMPARQSLSWIGQAVSGLLLVVILLLHMYFHHFQAGGLLSSLEVILHVQNPLIFMLEVLFVIVVTYHALTGVRAIVFDLSLSETTRRKISWGLMILSLATMLYGVTLAYLIRSQLLAP